MLLLQDDAVHQYTEFPRCHMHIQQCVLPEQLFSMVTENGIGLLSGCGVPVGCRRGCIKQGGCETVEEATLKSTSSHPVSDFLTMCMLGTTPARHIAGTGS